MSKGYTNTTLVAEELGRTLTSDQTTQAAGLIDEAEAFIDHKTGRAWMVPSPSTEILTVPDDSVVRLTNRPVTAVSSVSVRAAAIGATSTALVAGTSYELLDAAGGLLLVSGYAGYVATVSYSHATPAPADIRRAATLLVAHWLLPRLLPDLQGVRRLSVGGELDMEAFGGVDGPPGPPPAVMDILTGYRKMVFA